MCWQWERPHDQPEDAANAECLCVWLGEFDGLSSSFFLLLPSHRCIIPHYSLTHSLAASLPTSLYSTLPPSLPHSLPLSRWPFTCSLASGEITTAQKRCPIALQRSALACLPSQHTQAVDVCPLLLLAIVAPPHPPPRNIVCTTQRHGSICRIRSIFLPRSALDLYAGV